MPLLAFALSASASTFQIATGLSCKHLVVPLAVCHQLGVGSDFQDFALFQNNNAIGELSEGEAMADYDGDSALSDGAEDLIEFVFVFRIEGGSRLIKHQQFCLGAQQRSGDGDALPLSAG